jgi:hypothetical protein
MDPLDGKAVPGIICGQAYAGPSGSCGVVFSPSNNLGQGISRISTD